MFRIENMAQPEITAHCIKIAMESCLQIQAQPIFQIIKPHMSNASWVDVIHSNGIGIGIIGKDIAQQNDTIWPDTNCSHNPLVNSDIKPVWVKAKKGIFTRIQKG